jgi:hypothetical protein
MTDTSAKKERSVFAQLNERGNLEVKWTLTDKSITDPVYIDLPPRKTLPIIFVPGIMGSNLRSKGKKGKAGKSVWRLDAGIAGEDIPAGLAWKWLGESAKTRQTLLNPNDVEVDEQGNVPFNVPGIGREKEIRARGWGTVGETSYMRFLVWLQTTLNGSRDAASLAAGRVNHMPAPASWGTELPFIPITAELSNACHGWRFPVYAFGYNWLASNSDASKLLAKKINEVINENNTGHTDCEQVILVTHSMGGLVARDCYEYEGIKEKIAGIVHGVMPAVGAPVAYRRCKVGMWDEDAGASLVIGTSGHLVSAVFANAPGALQLLPSQDYGNGWLKLQDAQGQTLRQLPAQGQNPYDAIYKSTKWWGLMRPEWINPAGESSVDWDTYIKNVEKAKIFHQSISGKYHPHTFNFYGNDPAQKSFTSVRWRLQASNMPKTTDPAKRLKASEVLDFESRRTQVLQGGKLEDQVLFEPTQKFYNYFHDINAQCLLHDGDNAGDGTVPHSSGAQPKQHTAQQQFGLKGFTHEPAFKDTVAQQVTLYSIVRIVKVAKIPKSAAS